MQEGAFSHLTVVSDNCPLSSRVYKELKKAIIQGHFEPGEQLPEDKLTKSLGASRTPIREALTRLKGEGLVQIVRRKGASVVKLTHEEIDEIVEARKIFETAFFERSIENIPREEIRAIRDKLQQARTEMYAVKENRELWNQKVAMYLDIDFAFHEKMVRASGNRLWTKLYLGIIGQIKLYSHQTVRRYPDFLEKAEGEHFTILDALLAGDVAEAKWELRQHIERFRNRLKWL